MIESASRASARIPPPFHADPGETHISIWALCPLVLYLALSPVWAPDVALFRYDQARCLELLMLLMLMTTLALPGVRAAVIDAWSDLKVAARALIFLVIAFGALSSVFSVSPQLGWLELSLMIQLIFLFLCVSAAIGKSAYLAECSLAAGIVLGSGFFVLQFWATQAIHAYEGRPFSWLSPFLEFANVRFFNQYQAYTLLLLTLPVALFPLTAAWRMLVYLIAANCWAMQWMTGGRATWLSLALAVIAVAAFGGRRSMRWVTIQVALVILGGLFYAVNASFLQSDPSAEATTIMRKLSLVDRGWQSVHERATIIRGAIELIRKEPVLGIGPGQFGLHYTDTIAAHPHNSALQLLSEYGVAGGGAAVGLGAMLMFVAFRRMHARGNPEPDIVNIALSAALVSGLIDSLFSGNLTMPHSQVLLSTIAGWLIGRNVVAEIKTGTRSKTRFIGAVLMSTVVAATCLTTVLGYRYMQAANDLPRPFADRPPHFWQYGRWSTW